MAFRGFEKEEQLVIQMVLQNGYSLTAAKEALRSFRRVARLQHDRESRRQCYGALLKKLVTLAQEQEAH